jgi:bacterioferritin-associated ferredoxin
LKDTKGKNREIRMIVCHCNVLTESAITEAIDSLIDEDPYKLITPGVVYRQLGKRGKCCGCFPRVVGLIVRRLEEFQTSKPHLNISATVAGAAATAIHMGGMRPALQRD